MKLFKPHDDHMYFELVVVHALHFKILLKWGGKLRRLEHRICCTSMNMRTWESREFQLDNLWRPDTTGLIDHRYRCTSSRMRTTLHDIMIDWSVTVKENIYTRKREKQQIQRRAVSKNSFDPFSVLILLDVLFLNAWARKSRMETTSAHERLRGEKPPFRVLTTMRATSPCDNCTVTSKCSKSSKWTPGSCHHLWKKCRFCQIGNNSTNQIQVKSEAISLNY